jgi:hypothetical protein
MPQEEHVPETPYGIARRYAAGEITREQMIDALSRWRYVPMERMTDPADDVGVLDDGTFRMTVGEAFLDGLITAEDYDAILAAVISAGREAR